MNRRGLVLAIGVIAAGAIIWRIHRSAAVTPAPVDRPQQSSPDATYVGADACAGCHQGAFDAWRTSQHHDSMLPANGETIKGRFDGAQFRYDGAVSTFFQRDGRYWVRTDGADGRPANFEIKYAFGIDPLQQYLIELPKGHVQALSIAWDTRPKSTGGQRWFHLYPDERVGHGDELHWTQRQQNWNFMCADCHSTNLRKNYDAASNTFRTTWSEINVACEACHGPGSQHVSWAQRPASSRARAADNDLTVHLTERRNVTWTIDPFTLKPARSSRRATSFETDTCAHCHSRRAQIADGYYSGAPLHDFYEPATLEPSLYYSDGQQRGEVYNYGSFLQSRMAHAGVTCADCHEPHSARLRATGNALCTTCHPAARYDAPLHHHHQAAGAGASCVECHMPARTYMQIDARRDHSLRVPRPDLTLTMGAPNACQGCHMDRPIAWVASSVKTWLGRDAKGFQNFATVFHDAEQRPSSGVRALLDIATSGLEPSIVRASAVDRLGAAGMPVSAVVTGLDDPDPIVRRSALGAIDPASVPERLPLVVARLSDPIRSVRIAAARLLAPLAAQLTGDDRARFDRAAADLTASSRFNADRPEARVSFGVFLTDLGRTREAEEEYRGGIRLGPDFTPAYVNLAELLRRSKTEGEGEQVLRDGLKRNPKSAELYYALGLSLTRSGRRREAIAELKQASDLGPGIGRFTYAYALALNESGQSAAAIRVLGSALARHPDDRDSLYALVTLQRDAGQLVAARQHAARLVRAYPNDDEARALYQSLTTGRH